MQTITFSQNWGGRLFLDNFSDVRLPDADKFFVGNTLQVYLKGTDMGIVTIAAIRHFEFRKISDVLSYLICGKPAHYLAEVLRRLYLNEKKLQPDTHLVHLVLQYTERHTENQAALLTEWWKDKQLKVA